MINAVRATTSQGWAYIVFGCGILAGSTGPIFLRLALAEGIPTTVITVYRFVIASLLLTPLALNRYRHELRRLSRRDVIVALFAGVVFAMQLVMVFESYLYTSVLIAGVIVGSIPLWTALIERFILHAHFARLVWFGLAMALVGGTIIGIAGMSDAAALGDGLLLGGVMALGGALSGAAYLVIGRSVRNHVSFIPFLWLIFTSAALTAVILLLFTHYELTGYSTQGYLWMIMITIFPQIIAHGSFNYVLAYLPATLISIASQLVTVISAAAAFLIFAELPGPIQIAGSAVIIIGVMLAVAGQKQPT